VISMMTRSGAMPSWRRNSSVWPFLKRGGVIVCGLTLRNRLPGKVEFGECFQHSLAGQHLQFQLQALLVLPAEQVDR